MIYPSVSLASIVCSYGPRVSVAVGVRVGGAAVSVGVGLSTCGKSSVKVGALVAVRVISGVLVTGTAWIVGVAPPCGALLKLQADNNHSITVAATNIINFRVICSP